MPSKICHMIFLLESLSWSFIAWNNLCRDRLLHKKQWQCYEDSWKELQTLGSFMSKHVSISNFGKPLWRCWSIHNWVYYVEVQASQIASTLIVFLKSFHHVLGLKVWIWKVARVLNLIPIPKLMVLGPQIIGYYEMFGWFLIYLWFFWLGLWWYRYGRVWLLWW
jgi:hypothetical protein